TTPRSSPPPTATPASTPTRRPEPTARPTATAAATTTPTSTATAAPTSPKASSTAYDRAQKAVLEGRPAEARQLLEGKVRSGHGSPDEVRLLKALCKSPPDPACLEDIRSKY